MSKNINKPVFYCDMVEDQLYIVKRHGYGKIYKKKDAKLLFLDREDKKGFSWSPTLVDENNTKFIPLIIDENFLGNLEYSGYFNDKKNTKKDS
jgi:hypothetical protein